jgi:SAM-dependent methyltransferase
MHDRYTMSAGVYDTIYGEMLDYEELAARLEQIISARTPGAESMLEVACGTGLYLEQLRERYRVEGLDLSSDMLDIARHRLPGVPLHQGDMRTLDLGNSFDVVACLGSSVAYVLTHEDLEQTYRGFADHLADGGVVIVEPWLEPDVWINDHVGVDVYEPEDVKVARMIRGERRRDQVTMHMHHLVGASGQPIEHFVEEHATYLFTREQQLAAFEAAGLRAEYLVDEGGLGRGLYVAVRSADTIEPAEDT